LLRAQPPILIVDDDEPLARSMARALAEFAPSELAHSVEGARRKLAKRRRWELFVIDVRLGRARHGGLQLLELARERFDDVPAILVTGHHESQFTHEALRLGAILLNKPCGREELVRAYDEAMGRHARGQRKLAEQARDLFGLTDRECDVLEQRLLGRTRGRSAEALGVTVRTLDTHAQNIRSKIGISISDLAVEDVRRIVRERSRSS
jgi:FixJ family two-component response regulator